MPIVDDNKEYEMWLQSQCTVVEGGLAKKRRRMGENPLLFFRATCFRFAKKIGQTLKPFPELFSALRVKSVGDAHFENFGTWRDVEGRLIWGVNDFDDAARLPYTFDLIRLATSFALAPEVPGKTSDQCEALLTGYREGLDKPSPCVVSDEVAWMHKLLSRNSAKPSVFAADLFETIKKGEEPPSAERGILCDSLKNRTQDLYYGARQRGGGSLGRPRYVAFGEWRGGIVAREIKAIVPSAWVWAKQDQYQPNFAFDVATGKHRSPDPFFSVKQNYMLRRIAADAGKIDLTSFDAHNYTLDVIQAMGAEIAAIHSADDQHDAIRRDLDDLPRQWLVDAVDAERDQVLEDFKKWCAR